MLLFMIFFIRINHYLFILHVSVFLLLFGPLSRQVTQVDAFYNADQLSQIGHQNGHQMSSNSTAGQSNNVGATYGCLLLMSLL